MLLRCAGLGSSLVGAHQRGLPGCCACLARGGRHRCVGISHRLRRATPGRRAGMAAAGSRREPHADPIALSRSKLGADPVGARGMCSAGLRDALGCGSLYYRCKRTKEKDQKKMLYVLPAETRLTGLSPASSLSKTRTCRRRCIRTT